MLYVTPSSWFSSGLTVSQEGRLVTRVRFGWGMASGEFAIDGQAHSIRLAEPGLSLYLLETRGRTIARAHGWSKLFRRCCVVECAGRQYHVDCQPGLGRSYIVREGVETVGYIERQGVFARKAVASLPGSLALPAQVFTVAVVLKLWRDGNEMS